MRSKEVWFAATWSFVRAELPPAPSAVLELGCGAAGGLVSRMRDAGYDALGVDPSAPEGPEFVPAKFEDFEPPPSGFDAVVASTSLHHVDDLDVIVGHIKRALASGGRVIVVEWAWERFDNATAEWCFARLAPTPERDDRTWLHHHRDNWMASGASWDDYLANWTAEHGLHRADAIVDALDRIFERELLVDSPYFFSELDDTSAEDEQSAIDAQLIQPTGVQFVGRRG